MLFVVRAVREDTMSTLFSLCNIWKLVLPMWYNLHDGSEALDIIRELNHQYFELLTIHHSTRRGPNRG